MTGEVESLREQVKNLRIALARRIVCNITPSGQSYNGGRYSCDDCELTSEHIEGDETNAYHTPDCVLFQPVVLTISREAATLLTGGLAPFGASPPVEALNRLRERILAGLDDVDAATAAIATAKAFKREQLVALLRELPPLEEGSDYEEAAQKIIALVMPR